MSNLLPPRGADFAAIAAGDEVRVRHTFSAGEVASFARLSGDTNPLHLDPAFARTTAFGRPVVHGMLSAAHVSAIIGTRLPGPGALWFQQQFEFPAPVFVGDEVEFTLRVAHTSAATRTIVVQVEARNQHHALVMKGQGTVMLVEHDAASAASDLGAALVTGGSRGIGAAIARRLAADGRPVAVNYRVNRDAAERVVAEIVAGGGRAEAVQGDVSDPTAVAALIRACGERLGQSIGILVNNAARPLPQAGFLDCSWDEFDAQLRVQLGGAVLCTREVLPAMIARGAGRIVNIGSTAAWGVPPPNAAPYVAAKAALAALTRALAVEFGPKGVCVNTVSPSMVETDLVAHVPERLRKVAAMQAPLRRLPTPAQVADVVATLCGPAGAGVTGADIPVAAGSAM